MPSIFTFLWFSIFGDTALHLIMVEGYSALIDEVQADHALALFKLFERLPLTSILSFMTVILIVTFFVTSSDSGSLVIDDILDQFEKYLRFLHISPGSLPWKMQEHDDMLTETQAGEAARRR